MHNKLPILPSLISEGEPWCHLKTIGRMTGSNVATVRNKVSEFDLENHPTFSNFVHLSDFEKVSKTAPKAAPKKPARKRRAKK